MEQARPTARAIFDHAIEMSSHDARRAYVMQACGDDPELWQRVDALLTAYDRAGSFLETPVSASVGLAPEAIDIGVTTARPGDPEKLPLSEGPGSVIGSFKLLEQIGEGGMGVVFLAEQTRPVRRQVALKIVKAGMDTRQIVARFEAERQALALMDHPNIAKVFDGGATNTGRPYFIMEWVKGVPITQYCDEHRLTPRARLELFVEVCSAIQHAHTKGVIHRDLKPTNVLVALYGGKPVPKVIDFGVAKATGQLLTERTLYTHFGALVGTPQYMSPEQAEMNQLDIDTRSDIYSLGVLLYELLTGTTPVRHQRVKQAALLEVLRVIREEEPPRPSTRLSTIEQLPSIAAQRGVEPRKLTSTVRGDLDWIVMKCLEKDRARRYASAGALIDDLHRHLHELPVEARAARPTYRMKKFVRRHKVTVLAASAVVLALTIGLTAALVGFIDSSRQAVRADREAKRAIAEAARTQRGANFFWDFLQNMEPGAQRGQDTSLVRDALDLSVARIGATPVDSPGSNAELLALVGTAYLKIGELARAEALHRRALAYFQSVGEPNSTQLTLLNHLIDESGGLGKHVEAEQFQREAVAIIRTLNGPASLETANAENRLAVMLLRHQQITPEPHSPTRLAEAETLLRRSLAVCRQLLDERDALSEQVRSNLMDALQRQGRLPEADALYEELLRPPNKNALEQAAILHTRGKLRGYGGRWSEAANDLARAMQLNPEDDKVAFDLAIALLKSRRVEEYRRHCHAFLERAATNDQLPTADKAAKVSLLVPSDDADQERAAKLADRVASSTAATSTDAVAPWFQLCKALAELRRARFASAIDCANRVTANRQAARETQAAAIFITASAHARLGHSSSAREALAHGEALVAQGTRNVITESQRDWLVADLLRREAEQALSPAATLPATRAARS